MFTIVTSLISIVSSFCELFMLAEKFKEVNREHVKECMRIKQQLEFNERNNFYNDFG